MRLFSIDGIELHDNDNMDMLHDNHNYIYFSFGKSLYGNNFLSIGEPFDFSVCLEFLEFKKKLGEGGFG